MSTQPDLYDIPPTYLKPEHYRETASELLRRKRWLLVFGTGSLVVSGLIHGWVSQSATVFPRYGALITTLSLYHAYAQLRWSRMSDDIEAFLHKMFTSIEHDKLGNEPETRLQAASNANRRITRVFPKMVEAVQRQFVQQHLLVATIGTLIWAFGDLLPLPPN